MGSRGQTQWVVTSISHMDEMRDSDWSRPNLLRSDWLPIIVASMTTYYTNRTTVGLREQLFKLDIYWAWYSAI